jgi:hypothetical protein
VYYTFSMKLRLINLEIENWSYTMHSAVATLNDIYDYYT